MARSSFGLRPEDKGRYLYEELFQLVRYCKISLSEAWDMPVVARKWWMERWKKENEAIKKMQKMQNPKKGV